MDAQVRPRLYLFVGERPSASAYRHGWTWSDGHLAAKTLFRALRSAGIEPTECAFINLFSDKPWGGREREHKQRILKVVRRLRKSERLDWHVVAMGNQVSAVLTSKRIPHVKIVHPAARGLIRLAENYNKHIREVLT